MKRFRAKLVGFGLAAVAGSALAADGWQPAGQLAEPEPNAVVKPADEPSLLPAGFGFGVLPATDTEPVNPIWLPAPRREPPSPVVPVQLPELPPAHSPPVPQYGPRIGNVPTSPVNPVPAPPTAPQPPKPPMVTLEPAPMVTDVWRAPGEDPIPPRTSDVPPKMMPQPVPPPEFLPTPRPVTPVPTQPEVRPQPPAPELPVAPPELMLPAGLIVPGKHGTFGSAPVRLSRDYPSLSELCGGPARHGFHDGEAGIERGAVSAEYLLWWMGGLNVPILATTNPDPRRFGFIGEPGTTPILGPGTFLGSQRQGFRARGGFWFDDGASCGLDGSLFTLGKRSSEVTFTPEQFPIITRPIFSPNPRPGTGNVIGQSGEAVAVPGILSGSLTAQADSYMWGADINLKKCLFRTCDSRAAWFAGYRTLYLSESLSVTENIAVIGDGGGRVLITDPVGSVVVVRDQFGTENRFNGGQLGGMYERRWGRFSLDARASVALGATHQELSIVGTQTRVRPGEQPMTYSGGLLAAGPNLGTFSKNQFSVVPEVTMNVGYWITPQFKAYVGYNFLYWSNVIRPGEQIDSVVDLTFVPNAELVPFSGQYRPRPLFRQSDLWVTGLQFGLEWRW